MKIILTVVAALALTGCVSNDTGTDSTDRTDRAAIRSGVDRDQSDEGIARDLLREQHPEEFGHYTDAGIDDLAELTCDGLDDLTVDQLFFAGAETYGAAMGAVLMMSATVWCPEHLPAVQAWTS